MVLLAVVVVVAVAVARCARAALRERAWGLMIASFAGR